MSVREWLVGVKVALTFGMMRTSLRNPAGTRTASVAGDEKFLVTLAGRQ
jgi:hypothetical protein